MWDQRREKKRKLSYQQVVVNGQMTQKGVYQGKMVSRKIVGFFRQSCLSSWGGKQGFRDLRVREYIKSENMGLVSPAVDAGVPHPGPDPEGEIGSFSQGNGEGEEEVQAEGPMRPYEKPPV